jgi:hypothetical protein
MVRKRPPTALNLVETALKLPAPPDTLNDTGIKFWRAAHVDFDLGDAFALQLLEQICTAQDRLAEVRAQISREGDFNARCKLLKLECQLQGFIARTVAKLAAEGKAPGRQAAGAGGLAGLGAVNDVRDLIY